MLLKVGDVVFINHLKSNISKLFSKVMGSNWSHMAIVYQIIGDRVLLCETSDYQVNLNWYDRYSKDPNCRIEVLRHPDYDNVIKGHELTIQQDCDKINGDLYGYLQLPFHALRILLKRKIPVLVKQGWLCCNTVGHALKRIPGSHFDNIDIKGYDTEEKYKDLKQLQWVTIYKTNN